MKQVLVHQGAVAVEQVPAPALESGSVLVRVSHSCISVGTELGGMRAAAVPLWKRAVQHPERLRRAGRILATEGLRETVRRLHELSPVSAAGYSAAGVVLAAGDGVNDLSPGDRVACAGAQCAYHAEIVRIPRNLVVPIPDGVATAHASTVALGAIALQGVRRAQPTLGETFVVLGLGMLGQLTAQLLRVNGCRTIAVDPDGGRVGTAVSLGADAGVHSDGDDVQEVARLTGRIGADGVIITAASPSHGVVSTAFRMCRKKGRVVLVGDVGLNLVRADAYEKELDFFVSSSYGPGRYDRRYEEEGVDYPVGYVRWTENRNMAEYLRLLGSGAVDVAPLVGAVWPIDSAPEAYALLQRAGDRPFTVLLEYPAAEPREPARKVINPRARSAGRACVQLAVVGAGSFAKTTHLPNLETLTDLYQLRAVVSRTGHNAMLTARRFGAQYSATDYQEVLQDPEVDAVLVATRHHQHAEMLLQALAAGKHVLVEKPMALTQGEVDAIREFVEARPDTAPVLMTAYNRRFSAYARRIAELVSARSGPMIIDYRMNAGYIPADHWVHSAEGGGRNLGEACHIYDLFTFLTGSRVTAIHAAGIRPAAGYERRDNFVATLSFADGSVASLTYTALGNRAHPKEQMEVFVDDRVIVLDDYRRLSVAGVKAGGLATRKPDKGQREELIAFARAVREGGDWPIPIWQQLQAAEVALEVERRLVQVE